MVVDIPNMSLVKLDLIDFKLSLGNSLVRIQHAKLHSLAALCPNVEIVEHPELVKEHWLDALEDFQ